MPQRIDAETDYNILADIALKVPYKDIAKKYGVSLSYVSKVKTGKKRIEVYIPEQIKQANKLAYYKSDVNRLEEFFATSPVSLDAETQTLDSIIIQKVTELKVLLELRRRHGTHRNNKTETD